MCVSADTGKISMARLKILRLRSEWRHGSRWKQVRIIRRLEFLRIRSPSCIRFSFLNIEETNALEAGQRSEMAKQA